MDWRFWLVVLAAFCGTSAAYAQLTPDQELRAFRNAPPERAAEAETVARRLLATRQTPDIEHRALRLLANALADQGRCAEETNTAERAIEPNDASARAWYFAFYVVYSCEDYSRATELLIGLHQRHPQEIANLDDNAMLRVAVRVRNAALLNYIVDGGWTPDDPATDISELRLGLVRSHLADGNQAAALSAARTFADNGHADLGAVIVFLSDRTFDPIIATDPTRFSLLRLINRFADNGFAKYAAHPDRLSVLNALGDMLYVLNRADEALMLVDDALARIDAAGDDDPPFEDVEDALNWTYQVRARLRGRLGHDDEALSDLQAGAEQGEDGGTNVSQRLNRAGYLLSIDRFADALAQAEGVRPADLSPYGRSVRRSIMICAYSRLGRTEEMRSALVEAEARAADSYRNFQTAAWCANDLDRAARAYISRLESIDERRNAILDLQSFAGEPPPERWQKDHPIYGRSDVDAAIDRAMHLRQYPIGRPY